MKSELEKLFFKSVVQAVVNEEEELNNLFAINSEKYKTLLPYGVSCLFETTYVYIIIKQLLNNKFPLLVSWEHPYPSNNNLKADLALLDDKNSINSFVEFKIWESEDAKEIKSDIDKLVQETKVRDKYIVAIEYNSECINENDKFLKEELKIAVIYKTQLITSFFEDDNNKQVPMNIYFTKINKQ